MGRAPEQCLAILGVLWICLALAEPTWAGDCSQPDDCGAVADNANGLGGLAGGTAGAGFAWWLKNRRSSGGEDSAGDLLKPPEGDEAQPTEVGTVEDVFGPGPETPAAGPTETAPGPENTPPFDTPLGEPPSRPFDGPLGEPPGGMDGDAEAVHRSPEIPATPVDTGTATETPEGEADPS